MGSGGIVRLELRVVLDGGTGTSCVIRKNMGGWVLKKFMILIYLYLVNRLGDC